MKGFEGFVSKGVVSGAPDREMMPISILWETGSMQSLMVQGVIDLPRPTYLKSSTLVKGVVGGFISAHLQKVFWSQPCWLNELPLFGTMTWLVLRFV